jgi:hypothetical protein
VVAPGSRLELVQFLLVHSPVVGPSTWRWVAETLLATDHGVAVPDLRAPAEAGDPQGFVAEASATPSTGSHLVVVGHSGAGFFLPSIAERARAHHTVFVDAGLPPTNSRATAGGDFLEQLRGLAVEHMLPRWSTWWGEGVMEALVPDDRRRALVENELPEVPIAFFDTTVEISTDWLHRSASYVLLSDSYREDAERARALGWAAMERLGGHLDIVSAPEAIARVIVALTPSAP